MLLKIILAFVLFKIAWDMLNVKEGLLELEPPHLNMEKKGDYENKCNINIKLPNYDIKQNNFIYDNNSIFNNFDNIKKYANQENC